MNTPSTAAPRTTQTLKAAIAGQGFVRAEAGYDQGRRAWNLAMDQRPAVVVEAGSAADVAQAVRYARAYGMRIAPQGTGHGAEPLEPLDGAMLLRTTHMRQVRIDPAARTACAEAGPVRAHVQAVKDALAPWHASYDYYNFEETPAATSAVLPPASHRRLQEIKAAHDPDQVIISAHPVWPTRP